jgi:hypothetical protein
MVPVYAKDILHTGPIGFGWLNAASDIGSITMVIGLTLSPNEKKTGHQIVIRRRQASEFASSFLAFKIGTGFPFGAPPPTY